jgi:hypothetical protein
VDPSASTVHTDFGSVTYGTLVVSVPLAEFCTLLPKRYRPDLDLISSPGEFVVYSTEEHGQDNLVVYDCDPESPIFRVFTPSSRTATAHLSSASRPVEPPDVEKRLATLLGLKKAVSKARHISYPICYPLDITGVDAVEAFFANMRDLRIVFHGRMAEWKYIDLDDLDRRCLDEIVCTEPACERLV